MTPTQKLDRYVSLLEREPNLAQYMPTVYQVREAARFGAMGSSDEQFADLLDGLALLWRRASDETDDLTEASTPP